MKILKFLGIQPNFSHRYNTTCKRLSLRVFMGKIIVGGCVGGHLRTKMSNLQSKKLCSFLILVFLQLHVLYMIAYRSKCTTNLYLF